jgi:hypothetical protein
LHLIGWLYVAFLSALTVLSFVSLLILRAASPWTSLGWLCTIAYDVTASAEILWHRHLALHLPYWFLAGLTLAFVIAGVRDEAQAEPWWAPRHLGATRAQRQRSG